MLLLQLNVLRWRDFTVADSRGDSQSASPQVDAQRASNVQRSGERNSASAATRYPLVYIAGPYRNDDAWLCEQNIRAAESLGYRVAQLGAYPVIPHSNTRAYFSSAASDALWLAGTLELMRRCDGVVFLPTWGGSSGARDEHAEADRLELPVFGIGHVNDGSFAEWVAMFRAREVSNGRV
jgi:hypothetical protein